MGKKLLNAEQIPLVGLDGQRRSRRKEFFEAHGIEMKKPRPKPVEMPLCACERSLRGRQLKCLPDAFGLPTDKCELCRQEAAGIKTGIERPKKKRSA